MARIVKITAGSVSQSATLNESPCAEKIWDALPLSAQANIWGDEIYFRIPVECKPDNPRATVELGDLAYWPDGSCFCIFFGPTPMSKGDKIRPASAVEVFGKLNGDPKAFKNVSSGDRVLVERTE